MEHIAIDLGGMESQVCIRAADGSILLEQKKPTRGLEGFFKRRPQSRVILETCSEAFRVADQALAHGHEVRVVAATLVRSLGVGQRGIKTDQRDAQVLSEVSCRIDLPTVHIRSERSRTWKSLLGMRQALVESRTQLINSVRGWMRTQLTAIRTGGVVTFPQRVRDKLLDSPDGMPAFVERQLRVIEELNTQLKEADAEIKTLAGVDPVCQRLMTVPGVGPMTSSHFRTVVDDVTRFRSAHDLESYLGLTPGERSSSTRQRRTGITKAGPSQMRRTLSQACWAVWRMRPQDPLVQWGRQLADRRGKQIANIAMCRKLSGIMYALWRDESTYDASKVSRIVAGTWESKA